MKRSRLFALSLLALSSVVALSVPAAAQDLFVSTNRTLSGGNPINGNYGSVTVGFDELYTPAYNVHADITGGLLMSLNVTNAGVVTVSDGTVGPVAFTPGVWVDEGSSLNVTGGTLGNFVTLGNYTGSANPAISTLNVSGGYVDWVDTYGDSLLNVTGGYLRGMISYGGSTSITGGTVDAIFNYGGLIQFGGSAATSLFYGVAGTNQITGGTVSSFQGWGVSTTTVSGGTFGGGGVYESSQLTLNGSGLGVNSGAAYGYYDIYTGLNYIATDHTVTGTLADGTAINATYTAGAGYTGDSSSLTLQGMGGPAPDLFVTTDSAVSGIYNTVTVGTDVIETEVASPTVTYDGDTAGLRVVNGGNVTMAGGYVRGSGSLHNDGKLTVTGGTIQGITTFGDSTLTLSGGTVNSVLAVGSSKIVLNGGSVPSNISLWNDSSLRVEGSGLTGTGTAGAYYDAATGINFLNGGLFTVEGTLTDGSAISASFLAGGISGGSSQQTLIGATAAPDLFILEDRAINDVNSLVVVGTDSSFTEVANPTVVIQDGANLGEVIGTNASTIRVEGGLINGRLYHGGTGGTLEISGGTMASFVNIYPGNTLRITGGEIPAGTANIEGFAEILGGTIGSVDTLSWFGGQAITNIGGGTIGTVTGHLDSLTTITGGSISDVVGMGGVFHILGGQIGPDSLVNLFGSTFNIYGSNLLLTDATAGTFTDGSNGIWWNLRGTLANGAVLDTRYFEVGGSLEIAGGINLSSAAPEPGSFLLLLLALPATGYALRRRSR